MSVFACAASVSRMTVAIVAAQITVAIGISRIAIAVSGTKVAVAIIVTTTVRGAAGCNQQGRSCDCSFLKQQTAGQWFVHHEWLPELWQVAITVPVAIERTNIAVPIVHATVQVAVERTEVVVAASGRCVAKSIQRANVSRSAIVGADIARTCITIAPVRANGPAVAVTVAIAIADPGVVVAIIVAVVATNIPVAIPVAVTDAGSKKR
jgi:hypothetical protein